MPAHQQKPVDEPVEPAAAEEPEAQADDVPMNRAERRAKSKGGTQPKPAGKIQPGRVNPGHSQRQWSARRSGG